MQVFRDVDSTTANAIMYGLDKQNIDYYREKYNVLKNNFINIESSPFASFYNKVEYSTSNSYINDIKNKLLELEVGGGDDVNIYYYADPSKANKMTIDFIMSHPKLISLYERGLIDGYSGKYVHSEADAFDRYATVMNGADDDDDRFTTYYGYNEIEMSEEDKELTKINWKNCFKLWQKDIDPTLE